MTNNTSNRARAAETTVIMLAAGEGRRMLPLTSDTPKPLLKIGELSLLEHHLTRLQALGFRDVIINTAYLGTLIVDKIASGNQFNLNIQYSDESQTGALETAGGIVKALPLIKSDPFIVINADIWTDFDFTSLLTPLDETHETSPLAGRLVLVSNPQHNQLGDFSLSDNKLSLITEDTANTFTFSGIALYKKSIFRALRPGKHPLAPVLKGLIQGKALDQMVHFGEWTDVGTPARLKELNDKIRNQMRLSDTPMTD